MTISPDNRRKVAITLWAGFALFWAVMAVLAAMKPNVEEPWHGFPMLLLLYAAMVAGCALVLVRIVRHRPASEQRDK